jgi:hypothetical protein
MKNKMAACMFSFLMIGVTNACYADDVCKTSAGTTFCGSGTTKNVDAVGYVNIDGTTITDHLGVMGKVSAANANIGSVKCIGEMSIKGSVIQNGFEIIGFVNAASTNFLGSIEITGPETTFDGSSMKNITIKRAEHSGEKIYLEGNSVVNGNIVFESGNGYVIENNGSSISGKVIGGQIIHQ